MTVASGKPLSERKSYPTAYDDYIAHENLIKSGEPPKGAVVYYGKHKENWNCGHVGISDGEGNIISVVNRTKGVDITPLNYFSAPLLGWVTFKEYKSEEEVVEEEPALVDESLISTMNTSPHPWPMCYHDAQRTGRSSFIGPAELPVLKWTLDIPEDLYGSTPIAVAADNTAYLPGYNCLYSVKGDGSLNWIFELPEKERISIYENTASIGVDGTIYIASSGKGAEDSTLYAIDPDGTLKWKYYMGTERYGIFEVLLDNKDTIFVITSLGELLTISSDGNLKNSIIPPREDMLKFNMSIGADSTLYSGYERLYAWSADGTIKWMYDVGRDIYYTPPVIGDDGTIYVIFDESRLHAINPDGTLKWKAIPLRIGRELPAIGADGTVYVISEGEGLCALNSEDGTIKWMYEQYIYGSPIIDGDGTIYVEGKRLYAINPDGTLKWSYGGLWCSVIGADSTIYAMHAEDHLCAIGP